MNALILPRALCNHECMNLQIIYLKSATRKGLGTDERPQSRRRSRRVNILRPLDPACAIAAGNDRRALARRGRLYTTRIARAERNVRRLSCGRSIDGRTSFARVKLMRKPVDPTR